jgi:cytidyltransferase-like protein
MAVKLLKRAFGDACFIVYFQSISHHSDTKSPQNRHQDSASTRGELPSLVAPGGTWEGGLKLPLKDEHYLPIQPISKSKRRPSPHSRERLQEYLAEQSGLEETWVRAFTSLNGDDGDGRASVYSDSRPRKTIYMDGVFDLFHIGHLEAIETCAKLGDRVTIGVTGDKDATGYKRRPIVPEEERCAIVRSVGLVDEIVCPCPLIVTEDFMEAFGIDLVVHGFANDADADRQREFFEIPMKTGRFQRIPYYLGMSTTDRMRAIQNLAITENMGPGTTVEPKKPQWFGSTLTAATFPSYMIPYDPFPIALRQLIEPHIEKARRRRKEALDAIRETTGASAYDAIITEFSQRLSNESDFQFDINQHPLRACLLNDFDLSPDFDLSTLHKYPGMKGRLSQRLTSHHRAFQVAFDSFVRTLCAPHVDALFPCEEIYYQAFPCLRIVQPDEFSIGPHCDAAYGHHPCSVNFYVPLTQIDGTASLFLESRPGSEDWHPVVGSYGKFAIILSSFTCCSGVSHESGVQDVSRGLLEPCVCTGQLRTK